MEMPPLEPGKRGAVLLALMRIEGKVNYIITLLEDGGEEDD
ncbi:MAG TPA: hypothetical protein VE644_04420 [Gaiellaceae bacterium]|nr:hypothetical protein [Gaiellaceae bacterium]